MYEDEFEELSTARSRAHRPRPTALVALGCLALLIALVVVNIVAGPKSPARPPGSTGAAPATTNGAIEFYPVDDAKAGGDTPLGARTSTDIPIPSANPPTAPTTAAQGSPTASPTNPPTSTKANPATTTSSHPPAPPTTPAQTYAEVAGHGCPTDARKGAKNVGWWAEGNDGWLGFSSGGFTGNGCSGQFASMPMSGFRTQDDPTFYSLWWFEVGTASKSCAVETYVPTPTDAIYVSGKPAYYSVMTSETGPEIGTFTVDQRVNRGRWVSVGSYSVSAGRVVIQLHNRGEDWTVDAPTYEHIGVGQIRVTCHG
jgi:translation initiation factor IF-2